MSSMNATAPSSTSRLVFTSPTMDSCSGTTVAPLKRELESGCSASSVFATRSGPDRAASSVTPGFSRPTPASQREPRACHGTCSCLKYATGIHASTLGDGKSKPRGMTPTTVHGLLSSVTVRPTTSGAPPKRRCHSPWLSTTTLAWPCTWSSAVAGARAGAPPERLENPSVTKVDPQALGLAVTQQVHPRAALGVGRPRPPPATARAGAPVLDVRHGEVALGRLRRRLPQPHQPLRERGRAASRSSTPRTTPKMAVLAPIPSASVSTATSVKPGVRSSPRTPYRTSCTSAPHLQARSISRSL